MRRQCLDCSINSVREKSDNVPEHKTWWGQSLEDSFWTLKLLKHQLNLNPSITVTKLKEKILRNVAIRIILENIPKRLKYLKVKARVMSIITAKQRHRRVQFAKDRKNCDAAQ